MRRGGLEKVSVAHQAGPATPQRRRQAGTNTPVLRICTTRAIVCFHCNFQDASAGWTLSCGDDDSKRIGAAIQPVEASPAGNP
jgi:hypothetical protein